MCDGKMVPQLHWRRTSKKTLVTKEWLEAHFHLSHYEAAKKLEISASYFKKLCRFHGVAKWPYRQVALQKKLLHQNAEKTRLKTSISGCKRKKESPGSSDSETENDVKRQAMMGDTHLSNSLQGSTNEHDLDELRVLAACSLERNGVSEGPSDMCMHNETSDASSPLAMWLSKHIGSPDMSPQMSQPKESCSNNHVFPNIAPHIIPHSTIPVNPTPLEPTRGPNDLFENTIRRWSNNINDSMSSRPFLPSISDMCKETMLQHRSPVLLNLGAHLKRPVDVLALVASEAHAESENRTVCDRSDVISASSNHSINCSETSNDSASTLTFDVQSMCN